MFFSLPSSLKWSQNTRELPFCMAWQTKRAAATAAQMNINQNASGNERKSTYGERDSEIERKQQRNERSTQTHTTLMKIAIRFDAKTLWQICNFKCTTIVDTKTICSLPICTIIIRCVSARAFWPALFLSVFIISTNFHSFTYAHSVTHSLALSLIRRCVPHVYCT